MQNIFNYAKIVPREVKMKNKSNEKKGHKVIKTIAGIASTGLAVAAAVVTMNKFGVFDKINPNPDPTPMTQKLDTPENLAYDKDNQLLTWDSVSNATEYKLNINGDVQTVSQTSYSYIPSEKTSTFKVQAIDTTGNYLPSDWSSACSYTMEDQKQDEGIDLAKVDYFVNKLEKGDKLVKIASMYIDNNSYYVQGKFNVDGEMKVINLKARYKEGISSLSEAMAKEIKSTSVMKEYDSMTYDSANYLLKSNSYAGEMEEYRQAGYEFSVVSSCVGYTSSTKFTIYGTYKLTNGNDTKYLQNEVVCRITDSSPSRETNYTTKLLYTDTRNLEEKSCHELTGDLAEWAAKYDEKMNSKTNSTQSTAKNTTWTADLEYNA